ncbi:MAG: WG repeat-containing protein [Crocinitomicaceae bacterium]|nr:WG repeat-containing protein [Crocinitomicaceae bacterium]
MYATHFILITLLITVLPCCTESSDHRATITDQVTIVDSTGQDSIQTNSAKTETLAYTDSIYPYGASINSTFKYGYKNHLGKLITEPIFDLAGPFCNGFAPVVQGDVHGIIDTTGELIYIFQKYKHALWYDELAGVYEFSGVSECMYKIQINDTSFGYINQKHQLVTQNIIQN